MADWRPGGRIVRHLTDHGLTPVVTVGECARRLGAPAGLTPLRRSWYPSRIMKTLIYSVRLEPAEEGGYNVFVPALPGCHTQGETYEDAVGKAKECIEGVLEALAKAGEPVPVEEEPERTAFVRVQVNTPALA